MKEYIERAVALDICQKEYEERLRMADYCGDTVAWNIGGAIKSLPAADVAEVVRCKNCRYYQGAKINKKGFLICPASGMEITEADYCSYGECMGKEDGNETS